MLYILTAIATALITSILWWYEYEVKRPIALEKPTSLMQSWIDFIELNVDTSFCGIHCHACRVLITRFDLRFRKEVAPTIMNEIVQALYNRLDTKYKLLCREDEAISNSTVSIEKLA